MRAVLIGAGMVADAHLEAIRGTAGRVCLHGVLTRSARSGERCAKRAAEVLGYSPRVYPDIATVAADKDVGVVLLCTPPDSRLEIVQVLAAAGKPILMEKPIERNLKAARQIVEICEAADLPVGLVFQHRMRQSSRRAADILASGRLGPPEVIEVLVPWWRPQSYYEEFGRGSYARDGGGVLITQGIHTLELMLSLSGPVRRVQAMARTSGLHRMEAEDFVSAGLEFRSGAIGALIASTASFPGRPESITFHGPNGSLRLVRGAIELDWRDGRKEQYSEEGGGGGSVNPMSSKYAWHQGVLEDFVEALDTGRPPCVTGRTALEVHALIDAITASSRSGTAVTLDAVG